MINKYNKEKIERFINGKSDESEAQFIYSLFSENENNLEFEQQFQNDFNDFIMTTPDKNYNLSYLLDRIHHTINKNEGRKKQTIVKIIYKLYSVAAAVLLIPLIIAGGIWFFEINDDKTIVTEKPVTSTLFAPIGSRISFSLPDGTIGWLNSGSSIKYNIPFTNNSRNVSLQGEAWFDVAADENHPFEIIAGKLKVKVLGTKFNMSAYPEEKYVEVSLEEGKVEFFASCIGKSIEMKPNELLKYTSNSVNINLTETSKYSSWKDGKLVFRGDPMTEVASRIERWYNVEVELVDKELENYVIRGTFQDDSLEDVIKYLSMTSPIRYHICERDIKKDGTLQKKKVLIYKKNN